MIHPALLKLIRLRWQGGFRQLCQSAKTARGLFHLGFILAMTIYGIGSIYFTGTLLSKAPQGLQSFDQIQNDIMTVGLFVLTWSAVIFSTGDAIVHFTPAEVAFLFPAPLTRKDLLSYKLLQSLLGVLSLSTLLSLFTSSQFAMFVPRFLAVFMTVTFVQLLLMNLSFARQIGREKVNRMIRFGLAAIILVGIAISINQTVQSIQTLEFTEYVAALRRSTVATWLLSPFRIFVKAIRAQNISEYLPSASIILIADASLLTIAYRLDALSLEAALASSEKLAARLKKMQSQGVWQGMMPVNSSVAERRLGQFPFWGGIGPIVWQKMTTTFRLSSKQLWMMAAAIAVASWIVYITTSSNAHSQTGAAVGPIAGVSVMAYLSMMICLTMQNDIDRVGTLKALPIRTVSIVFGELIGFVVILSLIQSLFFAGLSCFFPQFALWLVAALILVFPFNFLLFAVDKLVFYIYPTRMIKGAPGDFQNSGRQMIFMMMKMGILFAASLIVGIATLPGALVLQSPLIAAISAFVMLLIECMAMTRLLVFAFDKFDPSVTMVS